MFPFSSVKNIWLFWILKGVVQQSYNIPPHLTCLLWLLNYYLLFWWGTDEIYENIIAHTTDVSLKELTETLSHTAKNSVTHYKLVETSGSRTRPGTAVKCHSTPYCWQLTDFKNEPHFVFSCLPTAFLCSSNHTMKHFKTKHLGLCV